MEGKEKGMEEKKNNLFGWREKWGRKRKMDGMIFLLCGPSFLFPSKLGVNDKEERVIHEELIFGVD